MIPQKTIEELINKHSNLEKDLSSGKVDKKLFAEKSKEYSDLNEIVEDAKKYISFENDKNNPDLLILNERIKTSKNMNFKNNVNFSNYKKSIINNFVSSDNFNLSNNRITDDIKKRIIELSRELSKKINL